MKKFLKTLFILGVIGAICAIAYYILREEGLLPDWAYAGDDEDDFFDDDFFDDDVDPFESREYVSIQPKASVPTEEEPEEELDADPAEAILAGAEA